MSDDDFDDDGFACPPPPLRPRGKRVIIRRHSQHTVFETEGPTGPIRIESSTTITVETAEDDWPPRAFGDGFSAPATRRLPRRRKR